MDITYRSGNEEDLEEIEHLIKYTIAHLEKQGIRQWDDLYPTREDFEDDIREGQLFVGIGNGEIAVTYTLNQLCDEDYRMGKWKEPEKSFIIVHRLCVHPLFQNKGIAIQTMKHIEEDAKQRGMEAVRLDVYSENPAALRLYEKCGYTEVGTVEWRKGSFCLMEKYL